MTTADQRPGVRRTLSVITQGTSLRVDLAWRVVDPLAVDMSVFPAERDAAPVEWVLSREQVAAGCVATPGTVVGVDEGQVHLRRQVAGPFVEVILHPGQRDECSLIFRVGDLRAFLASTYAHVPLDQPVEVPDTVPADWK